MTQRDDLDRLLSAWVDDPFTPPAPRYLPQVLDATRRTRQRRAWASLERWLPMTITLRRPLLAPPMRWLAIGLTLLLLAAVALAAGSALRNAVLPALVTSEHPQGLVAYENGGDIWTWDPAADEHTLVARNGVWPLWSPDGTRIFFWGEHGAQETPTVLTLGGGDPLPLMEPGLYEAADAVWSPDGTLMAVTSKVDDVDQVTVVDAIHGGLVAGPFLRGTPMVQLDWIRPGPSLGSPDLSLLVRHVAGGAGSLWQHQGHIDAYPAFGGHKILDLSDVDLSVGPLTAGYAGQYDLMDPQVTAGDQPSIAFTQLHDLGAAAPDGNGFRVHVFHGTTDHAIVFDPEADDEAWPIWDPSGTRIVFQSFDAAAGGSRVVVMPVACGSVCPAPLATNLIPETDPNSLSYVWSPDGERLLVVDALQTGRAWMVDLHQAALRPPSGGAVRGAASGQVILQGLDWTSTSGPSWRP